MNRKLISRISALVLASAASVPAAQAYDFEVGGIYYNINNTSVSVTYADLQGTYRGNVVIPSEVTYQMRTYPVKAIDYLAFINSADMTSVTLPDGITQIYDQAFSHCSSLTEIRLPAKLQRIADYAFEFCTGLDSVTIPASVTQIGYAVFTYCRNLRGFAVAEGNPVYEAVDGVLYSKGQKMLVQYPASKTGPEFNIPETVTRMPDCAFAPQYYLHAIGIPASLTDVRAGSFADCAALTDIEVAPENPALTAIDGLLFDKDVTTLLQYPVLHEAEHVEIPSTVTSLGDLSMLGAAYVHTLELPASLTEIGTFALAGCSGLSLVICHATVPPVSEANPLNPAGAIFDDPVYLQSGLQVPAESLAAYKANPHWGKFSDIYEIGGAPGSAIGEVEAATDTDCSAYDLLGRRLPAGTPRRGFRIEVTPAGSRLVR